MELFIIFVITAGTIYIIYKNCKIFIDFTNVLKDNENNKLENKTTNELINELAKRGKIQ